MPGATVGIVSRLEAVMTGHLLSHMFTAGQAIPGLGKRRAREVVLEKEAEVAERAIAVRARGVVEEVKRTCAEMHLKGLD